MLDIKNILAIIAHIYQKFLARSIGSSTIASMIYGVSKNGIKDIGYNSSDEPNSEKDDKLMTLNSHIISAGFVPK